MITLTPQEWEKIKSVLEKEWPRSVLLMRSVMRRELGFTVRTHDLYDPKTYSMKTTVYLDFFDDAKETWFRLAYMNYD